MNFLRKIGLFFTILLCMGFLSCERYTAWELEEDSETRLVVEAILTDENSFQEIRLSQSFISPNGRAEGIIDAQVQVEANGVVYGFLHVPGSPGLYLSERPFGVFANLSYHLKIDWQGEVYEAVSKLSRVAPIPGFSFVPKANTDELSFGTVPDLYSLDQQAMYEVDLDWSALHADTPNQAKMYFYTFSSVHITGLLLPKKEQVYFPKGTQVHIRKLGLNEDFAAYLRALLIETDWSGNFYYTTPENLPTNISNQGLGFFSTCAVLKTSLTAE